MSTDLPLVIALVAQNENDALRNGSKFLCGAMDGRYRHTVIDLHEKDGSRRLLESLKHDNVAFVYGLAGVGSQLHLDDGSNLWIAARTPFLALWYDPPCYNYRQHIVDSPYVVHCYHVRDHIEARAKHLPAASSRAVLLPVPCEYVPVQAPQPLGVRPNIILYAKTAMSPSAWIEDWQRHPEPLRQVLHVLADQATRDRNLDLADAAKTLFGQHGLSHANLDVFMGAIQEVDAYVRAWRSDRFARALLPHPAHIVGRGWDYLRDEPRQAVFMPPVNSREYWLQIWNYKLVANTNPLWRDGMHERVWAGIISGALTLTDRTEKADAFVGSFPNYLGFEWQDNLEDVISMGLRRAREDDADYLLPAHARLAQQPAINRDSYITLLGQESERVRKEAS